MATTLITIVLDIFGTEALNWDQVTLENELVDSLRLDDIPQINRDKLQSLIMVITSNAVQNDWMAFNIVCEALNNDPVDHEILDPVDPEQMAWGLAEILLHQDPKEPDEFSSDVRKFMGAILDMHGIGNATGVLKLAIRNKEPDPSSLAEDPIMYEGYFTKVQTDNAFIREYLAQRYLILKKQLKDLPLKNHDPKEFSKLLFALEDKARELVDVPEIFENIQRSNAVI